MDMYFWLIAGSLLAGFLAWWLPQEDKIVYDINRDDSALDDDGDGGGDD